MNDVQRLEGKAKLIGLPPARVYERVGVTASAWFLWKNGERTPTDENQKRLVDAEKWLDRMISAHGA